MSNTTPNVWQARSRQSHSASRTPIQNRSATSSPAQQTPPTQPPPARQPDNVWAQRSSQRHERQASVPRNGGSNSVPGTSVSDSEGAPANGFNREEVKSFLGREAQGAPAVYKVADGGSGKGAWGAKANVMANGQPFLVQLAKQLATLEGGG